MELSGFKKIYIVGIEGAGTSGLAQIYHNLGFEVSGSDNGDHFYWDVLRGKGIKVFQKFDAANVPDDIDFAVHSSAFKDDNPEIAEIKKRGIPLYTYSKAMGEFFNQHVGISVCGSHGKTTTSAILATALKAAGVDTSAFVGSRVLQWNSNVLLGGGEYFVFESDEYQNKLQYYEPWAAILTSVDWDHPDFFPDFEVYKKAFKDFVAKLSKTGFLVVWGDSIATLEVAKAATSDVLTYGFGEDNLYRIVLKEKSNGDKQEFEVFFEEKSLGIFETPLTGKHNVLNSCSVIAMCHRMQLDLDKVKEALADFKGTARRFEKVGTRNGALLIDDYAHHPDEVKATLAGARERFGDKNITVVFHPHSFTRTKALLHEFAQSFDDADKVVVIDIYGSARETEGDVSSEDLVKLINKYAFDKAEYVPTINEAIEFFENKLKENDVLITMGAGDVWKVADKLKEIK
jgi:UDP-N-acetylmuramate--alanine ligase